VKTRLANLKPTDLELALGTTHPIWQKLIAEMTESFPMLRQQWRPSKIPFGRVCLLKLRDRTLLYLIPQELVFEVSVVLGERAVALAMASDLQKDTKKMISESRQYAEGRGIRFAVRSTDQIQEIRKLVTIKTTPK
jgi:hypothetical protein